MIEERVLDFESAAPIALNAKDFAVDDASYLRAALTEWANPELVSEFESQLTDRLFGEPILLNADLKAGKSRVWRTIGETNHPRTIGQLANFQDFHRIGDPQLPEHIDCKTLQLKSFNSYHADPSFSRFVVTGPKPHRLLRVLASVCFAEDTAAA